jgi:YHS domain-containing protein
MKSDCLSADQITFMQIFQVDMKLIPVFLLTCLFIVSCRNAAKQAESNKDNIVKTSVSASEKNKFPGIAFAAKKDLSCGMPLTAGVEDTAHYKGKIYGFCSKECKDDFLKKPESYIVLTDRIN